MKTSKTIVIGLDGATFDLMNPWLDAGELPHIKHLMENGSSGILKSTTPAVSPVAWSSFLTGVHPCKHGIIDFMEPMQYGRFGIKLNTRVDCKAKPIWRYLNDEGAKTIVINVPMTFPPDRLDGVMISGMDAPGLQSDFTYPRELKDEILRQFGRYVIDVEHSRRNVQQTESYGEQILDSARLRLRVAQYLMKNKAWDFFMIVFMATDRMQHEFWEFMDPKHPRYTKENGAKYGDSIRKVYRELDTAVGEIVRNLPDDTNVVIMSDHGFGPVHTTVALNEWLIENGYLVLKAQTFPARAARIVARYGESALGAVNRLLGKPTNRKSRFLESIDWTRSRAFFLGTSGKVFICEEGRFPQGIVKRGAEYERLRDELAERLRTLTDPANGASMVEAVLKREDVYKGDFLAVSPDLIVQWRVGYNSLVPFASLRRGIRYRKNAPLTSPSNWSGDHLQDGIFIINSPAARKGETGLTASIVDVCPTILYLMDAPIPESLDGRVLTCALTEETLSAKPIRYYSDSDTGDTGAGEEVYSGAEAKLIEQRLKNLGYLE